MEVIQDYQNLKDKFIEKKKTGAKYIGQPTGFIEIDDLLDGLWDGQFYTIAAPPSIGKTMLAINFAYNLSTNGQKVVFYSLEMSAVELYMRLMGIYSGIYSRKILKNTDDKAMLDIEAKFAEKFLTMGIVMVTDLYEYEAIQDDMIEKTQNGDVDVFFLDYLQNMLSADPRATEYQLLSKASRQLQSTARACEKPFVAMSQVTKGHKASDGDGAGAKGTGAIHEVSDVYMELEQIQSSNDEHTPELRVFLKKNRHGARGEISLIMDVKSGKIISLDPYHGN